MFKARNSSTTASLSKVLAFAGLLSFSLPASVEAGWREEIGVFRIGIATVGGDPFKPDQFALFQTAVGKALDVPVEIFQARDVSSLVDAIISSRIEYAIMPALGYALVEELCNCTTPLAAPTAADGANAVRAILVADGQTHVDLASLASMRIAIGPDSSLTGSIIPRVMFDTESDNVEATDAQYLRASDHESALRSFMNGDVDGFFTWQNIKSDEAGETALAPSRHVSALIEQTDVDPAVLWASEPVRFGPHIVRKDLPGDVTDTLRQMLLDLADEAPWTYDSISPDLAGGFVAVEEGDYTNAKRIVRSLGEN